MTTFGKVWGATSPLLESPLVQLARINVRPRSRCSRHHHRLKSNAFYCLAGRIEIHVEKTDYGLTDVTVLTAGDFTTVPPGLVHWFQTADEGAELLELYYLEPLGEDIVRRDSGASERHIGDDIQARVQAAIESAEPR